MWITAKTTRKSVASTSRRNVVAYWSGWESSHNTACPGIPSRSRIAAHQWLSLAAAQGVEDAAKARDTLARKMTGRELAEASRRAKAFSSGEPSTLFLGVAKILGDKGKGLRSDEPHSGDRKS